MSISEKLRNRGRPSSYEKAEQSQQLDPAAIWPSPYGWPALPPDLPRRVTAAHRRLKLLSQSLLDHWPPRHQAESHTVIQHCVAPADKHEAAPVDAGHALPFRNRSMLQASFRCYVLRSLAQLPTP